MRLDLAGAYRAVIYIVTVQQIDRLCDHLHMPEFLGRNIHK